MPRGLDLLLILFVLILLFGARRLPQIGGAIGQEHQRFQERNCERRINFRMRLPHRQLTWRIAYFSDRAKDKACLFAMLSMCDNLACL